MTERNVWLFRAHGEDAHDERFCFTKDDLAEAYLELVIGGVSGDPVVDEQKTIEINNFLLAFNRPDEWADGSFYWPVGETGQVGVYRINPKSIGALFTKVAQELLFI